MIQIVYLAVYLGFNVFFGVFFVIGIRGIVKMVQYKKRKKNFTTEGKAKYVHSVKIRERIGGYEYRYTYKIKVGSTEVESSINSTTNEKLKMTYPSDNKWHPVMVNPENHSEFRFPCEDNAIKYYKRLAIAFVGYGLFCRILFELAIWGAFLTEGGLK